MTEEITLKLSREELDHLLEGLSEQAEAWERTGENLHTLPSVQWSGGRCQSGDTSHARGLLKRGASKISGGADRLQSYEFALAYAALDRMAARYRDIMDKILEQAQACGWKL